MAVEDLCTQIAAEKHQQSKKGDWIQRNANIEDASTGVS